MKQKAFYDTSMFFEPYTKSTDRKIANKIFAIISGLDNNIYQHYSPVTSLSVLGEIEIILRDVNKINRFSKSVEEIRHDINRFLEVFEIVGIKKEAINVSLQLLNKDDRGLTPIDTLNFGCCVAEKCDAFFFIDNELKKNIFIKEEADNNNITLSCWN